MTPKPQNHLIFFTLIIFTVCLSNLANAQPSKGRFIDVSAGLGLSAPSDDIDITGSGFYAQGEYVWGITTWFGIRPYAGVVFTFADKNDDQFNPREYKVTSKAFMAGGKVRLVAPIPYVAPYLEAGIGASFGSFETFTPYVNLKEDGILMHIPFTIGLAIGRRHNFEFEFTYYYHPSVEQYAGAAAFGFSFPIN